MAEGKNMHYQSQVLVVIDPLFSAKLIRCLVSKRTGNVATPNPLQAKMAKYGKRARVKP